MCDCFLDDEARLEKAISRQIDRELQRSKREQSKELKLLLLGTGEAGKSTFIKQMRIIHGQGYTDADRADFRSLVFRNIFTAVHALTEAMPSLKIPFQNAANKESGTVYGRKKDEEVTVLSESDRDKLKAFWMDRGVQSCFERSNEFQISDSAKYYLDALDRICAPNYLPTVDDVLRIRIATTGIVEYTFPMRKDVVFRMVDVGGQRSERRKWIHCFEDVKAIIFLTAINEYDQVLVEDDTVNRLKESLALFETILRYPWFEKSSIVLFMNKEDIFKEKIMKSDLARYFPTYEGPKQNNEQAREFLKNEFLAVNPNPERIISPHFTCATDTENISRVFETMTTSM
ncbi:hypothetical protein EMCRGX_G030633 [Ephydatia muelleri]